MKRIIKDEAPIFWSDFRKKYPKASYHRLDSIDGGKELRLNIRNHMTEQQKYLCCYCCKRIGASDSHNEHIKPRELYPQLSMDYNNLLVSCTSNSCGMAKSREYDEKLFVSPLSENCETHFRYEEDGHIVGITEMGKYTVDLLRLNTYALVDARKNLYKECSEMAKYCGTEYVQSEYIREKEGRLPPFADMVSYFFKLGYFAPDMLV